MPGYLWEAQRLHFSGRYRVILMDPRSQGDSQIAGSGHDVPRRARDLHELLVSLEAREAVLVGWSLGASEILGYFRQFGPDRLAGAALVDGSVGMDGASARSKQRAKFLSDLESRREITTRGFVRSMYRSRQEEAYLEKITRSALGTPTEAAVQLLQSMYDGPTWRPKYGDIPIPLLFAYTPRYQADAKFLKRNLPGLKLEFFPGAGHALFVDEAPRFNLVLDHFLSSLAEPRTASRTGGAR
jgi:microsomal epoxide hydrolase